uniref:C-type lectin domain-containing protein n=1 Tax=Esox lucius TaxID=8010 RepID=A0A3P8XTX5_ESOLU
SWLLNLFLNVPSYFTTTNLDIFLTVVLQGHTGALGNGASLSLGGHLASVHSWLESIFLEALTIDLPLTWIGGTDGGQPQMTQDRSWSWTDGSGFNYHEWAQGEPKNYNGVRDVYSDELWRYHKHRWNDDVCEKRFASVCSRSH